MLSEKQCIDVAEKVWGWKKVKWRESDPNSFDCWIDENRGLVCDDTVISEHASKAVNSWSGFGRTVEGMSNRPDPFYRFTCDKHTVEFIRCGLDGMPAKTEPFEYWDCSSGNATSIIEATHLAALEVINDK